DDIIGILNTRDFLLNAQSQQPRPLRQLLRDVYMVPETVAADTLFSNMQKQKIHLAVVVDEYGGMSGIVTMEDLLEEIVGNIYDEFDPSEDSEIEKLGENLWRVNGTVELETLAEALGVDLPLDQEYDTLGGMVFSSFSSIPEEGTHPEVTMYGLHIRVESICDHRVEKALVSKVETPETDAKEEGE
ncbi:MAG: CBS domain-containing protein, partial [Clostridiales bacterium]|nr:CBS domain-containing protein [Clostridiales bacterium]